MKIHPSFWLYLGSMALLSSPVQSLCACAALCVHELSHCIAACMVGERIDRIEITPFGGVMVLKRGCSSQKGLRGVVVAAAGPLGNYLFILLLGAIVSPTGLRSYEILYQLTAANVAMMAINLLPALPLDGGRILFCLGYYLLHISRLLSMLSALGAALGVGLIGLGLYGMMAHGSLNLSMLIVGGYLLTYAQRSRASLLSENLYAVVQERLADEKRIAALQLYAVSPDTSLYTLIPLVDRTGCAAFVCEDGANTAIIGEKEVLRAWLREPTSDISALAAQRRTGNSS